MSQCEHEEWSDDPMDCECVISHCLECYVTIYDLNEAERKEADKKALKEAYDKGYKDALLHR